MPIFSISPKTLQTAAETLLQGQLVAFPTETVYGLGANALDPMAVAKIFSLKNRPTFDPLIVHVASLAMAESLCFFNETAYALANKHWPGPLTLVLPKKPIVPDLVCAGLDTVAIRIPRHSIAQQLLQAAGIPIAAPSANPFGRLSPTTAKHVEDGFLDSSLMILDGGPTPIGLESTIVGFDDGKVIIYRLGGLSPEQLNFSATVSQNHPVFPGSLPQHYAPRNPLKIVEKNTLSDPNLRTGLLAFSTWASTSGYEISEILSPNGHLEEAASRLFACLHRLDRAPIDQIFAEEPPHEGLGFAILDRLKRAERLV